MKRLFTKDKFAILIFILFFVACQNVPESMTVNDKEYRLGEKAFSNGNSFLILQDFKNALAELSTAYSHFLVSGSNEMAITSALKVYHVHVLDSNNEKALEWLGKAEKLSKGNQNLLFNKIVLAEANAAILNQEYSGADKILKKFVRSSAGEDLIFEMEYINLLILKGLKNAYSSPPDYLTDNLNEQFIKAVKKEHRNPLVVSSAGYELAELFMENGKLKDAGDAAEIAHDVDQIYNYVEGLSRDCLLLAKISEKLNKNEDARYYLLKAKEFSLLSGNEAILHEIAEMTEN